ncbi:Diadenylate cyclase spyDAC [Mucinivorans hirudinis]|uniref:Diadenylate cyclase n=1 Tax=Mucinivorans hirudinis TaxID=1433126 RepID=A0A060RA42_9BACT|nr:Diadenylate cyclase spyDAC [Mucinivorans hirudinis]
MSFIDFSIIDAIDIAIVGLLIWQIYRAIRGTAAFSIFWGIALVYLLWLGVKIAGMELLSVILGQVMGVGVLALIIVFQPEIRRYLLMIGSRYSSSKGVFGKWFKREESHSHSIIGSEEIAKACYAMSTTRTGALIAIERKSNLDVYAETGDIIDAELSNRLIQNIFFKNSPLHDGAMIMRDGRIWAARCILPTSENPNIPPSLGLRHRAAFGLSENTDALLIVVSEETGGISVIDSGKRRTVGSYEELLMTLS